MTVFDIPSSNDAQMATDYSASTSSQFQYLTLWPHAFKRVMVLFVVMHSLDRSCRLTHSHAHPFAHFVQITLNATVEHSHRPFGRKAASAIEQPQTGSLPVHPIARDHLRNADADVSTFAARPSEILNFLWLSTRAATCPHFYLRSRPKLTST